MSVWGTVHIIISLEAFPGSRASTTSLPWELVSCLGLENPDLPKFSAYALSLGQPTPSLPSLLRPSITDYISTGILTRFPSTTHFCLALGADSPCADERCAGNLGLSARVLFTLFIATHVSIRTSDTSSIPHETPSQAYRTLSYRVYCYTPEASVTCLAPLHLPRRTTRLVSYYAFFKGWLLLSQPPSCLCLPTSFST